MYSIRADKCYEICSEYQMVIWVVVCGVGGRRPDRPLDPVAVFFGEKARKGTTK